MSGIDEANDRKEVVKEFAIETTMHGLKFLYARGVLRKIVWLILLLGSCCLVYMQVYQQFIKYLAKDISTQIDMSYPPSIQFPSVMICNSNMFRISKVYKYDGMYEMITNIFTSKRSEQNRFTSPSFKNYSQLLLNLKKDSRSGFNDNNATIFAQNFGHNIQDMLTGCTTPSGSDCMNIVKNISIQMTDIGPCFVFNMTTDISQAGPANALTLYINLQAYESMIGPSQLSSLKVLIYGNNDYPVVSSNAIDVAPGYMSVIGLKYHQETRLSSCIEPRKTKHFTEDQYSAATCQLDEVYSGIEKSCNCSPHYAPKTNVSACKIDQYLKCVLFFNASSVLNSITNCNESCNTEGYSTSLSLAKISSGIQKKLENDQKDNLVKDFGAAMEATSRKDPTDVKRLHDLISIWTNQTIIAKNLGLWSKKTAKSTLISLKQSSASYSKFVDEFYNLINLAKPVASNPPSPEDKNCMDPNFVQVSGPSSSVTDTTVNVSTLSTGYQTVMSDEQKTLFGRNIKQNIALSEEVFKGWDLWKKLLSNPCPYNYTPDGGSTMFFDNMITDMADYTSKVISKYQWAILNNQKYESEFPSSFGQISNAYVSTARTFLDTLESLITDNLTQTIFANLDLDDQDIDNSAFWLSINYASTAKFLFPYELNGCKNGTTITSTDITYNSCFSKVNGADCTNCSSSSGSSGGSSSGSGSGNPPPQGRRKRQGPPNGGSGSNNFLLANATCCSFKIWSNNTFYRSFFKTLRDNLQSMTNDTVEFLESQRILNNDIISAFVNLSNELSTYSAQFTWGDEFYAANFLGIQIYFSELSVQVITQSLPYDFFCLICDIGGSLGLFLGASILTFFEVIDMLIFGICKTSNRINKFTKTQPE